MRFLNNILWPSLSCLPLGSVRVSALHSRAGTTDRQSDTPLSTCPDWLRKELGQRWGRGNKSAAITLKSEDMTRVGGRGACVTWVLKSSECEQRCEVGSPPSLIGVNKSCELKKNAANHGGDRLSRTWSRELRCCGSSGSAVSRRLRPVRPHRQLWTRLRRRGRRQWRRGRP